MAKRRRKRAAGNSAGGDEGASDAERRAKDKEAADRFVAYYLDARDGPRTDGAPPEADCLEALYRDLIRDTFEPGSSTFRVPRWDAVAPGMRHPALALHSFAYDLVRAARDVNIDRPYRELATVALSLAMVLRAALPNEEASWRKQRQEALQVPEPWLIEMWRERGFEWHPVSARMVLPDLRVELERLGGDTALSEGVRAVARDSIEPISAAEYLPLVRRVRALLRGRDEMPSTPAITAQDKAPRTTPIGASSTEGPPPGDPTGWTSHEDALPSKPTSAKLPELTPVGRMLAERQYRVFAALRENLKTRGRRPSFRQLALDARIRFEDVKTIYSELKTMGYVLEQADGSIVLLEPGTQGEQNGNAGGT
jgi:hypothetical protein